MNQVFKRLNQVGMRTMKTACVVMLLQFIAPAFITTPDEQLVSNDLSYTSQHNSLMAPQLLKEKEEDELKVNHIKGIKGLVELFDLSHHAFGINDVHNGRQFFVSGQRFPTLRVQLFALHRSFLI